MTLVITKQQLDQVIESHKIGKYLIIDDGEWVAIIIDTCKSTIFKTSCIIAATQFLLGITQ